MWFWCISELEKSSNLDISLLVGRFQLLEFCSKSFHNRWGGVRRPLQHPVNDALLQMKKLARRQNEDSQQTGGGKDKKTSAGALAAAAAAGKNHSKQRTTSRDDDILRQSTLN